MQSVAGIYLITCRPPGKLPVYYVGQTKNAAQRKKHHLSKLRHGRHINPKLQSYFAKYGELVFAFELLEECDPSALNEMEQWWLDEIVGHSRVFNIGIHATSGMRGRRHAESSRAEMSAKHRGKKISNEHILALRQGRSKKGYSEEERRRRSTAQKGRVITSEHRRKIGAANSGRPLTADHRANISSANSGEKHWTSGLRSESHPLSKMVEAVHLVTGQTLYFGSTMLAQKSGFNGGCISQACRGKLRQHKGYRWRYIEAIQSVAQPPERLVLQEESSRR